MYAKTLSVFTSAEHDMTEFVNHLQRVISLASKVSKNVYFSALCSRKCT